MLRNTKEIENYSIIVTDGPIGHVNKHSPDIDTHKPVSRQNEEQYLGYFGYPNYWSGGGVWGAGLYPYAMVSGYAGNGVDGVDWARRLVDDETWAVRYVIVDTSNWWLGHKVLIAPAWISGVRWTDKTVSIDLSRESVKAAPVYDPEAMWSRELDRSLYQHYGRAGYWSDSAELATEI